MDRALSRAELANAARSTSARPQSASLAPAPPSVQNARTLCSLPSASATRSANSAATTTTHRIRLGDEIPQQFAARRGVERHRHRAELGQAPDRPDEFRAVRHHHGDMVALADAELAKAVGVTVGKIVRLRIGIALLAKDQPGPIADRAWPCRRADGRWCVVSADSHASFRHQDKHRPERSNVRIPRAVLPSPRARI